MSRPKRQATKFIPNHTTLHHPPGGSADQCGGPLPPLREAQLLRRHLQQHRPLRPPPPRAHRRPRRPSFFLFFRTPFLSFSSIANAPLVVAVVRGFVDFGKEVDVLRDTKQKSTLMAGRLRSVDDDTHKLEVDCNGEGVVFAEAFMARVLVYYSPSHNTVTLDLSSSGPLRVCVYSDPGAHLSVKFPSKVIYENLHFLFDVAYVTDTDYVGELEY
ncbi:hypothetical protein JHK87_010076 [Glycine soja]|nr:hypothetical protein JHK87_010076 [Glycine soja]